MRSSATTVEERLRGLVGGHSPSFSRVRGWPSCVVILGQESSWRRSPVVEVVCHYCGGKAPWPGERLQSFVHPLVRLADVCCDFGPGIFLAPVPSRCSRPPLWREGLMAWSAATVLWAPAYEVAILAQKLVSASAPSREGAWLAATARRSPASAVGCRGIGQVGSVSRHQPHLVSESSPKIPELSSGPVKVSSRMGPYEVEW